MAFSFLIQFEQWSKKEVANWLEGLDDAVLQYIPNFKEEIDGKKLLMLTHSDLEKLGVNKLGHQELIMEAVDLLKSLRYMFETENLQHLALQLGCKARSLHNEILALNGENDPNRANILASKHRRQLSVSVLSSICDITTTLRMLTSWLDRPPFEGIYEISLLRNSIVKLGLELVVIAQKESGITDIENAIVKNTVGITGYCDELVLNIKESLIVQPASLEIATIRKKQGDELGMNILSSYFGVHVIGFIKDMSPADLCSKIEKGDEVLQVNNQTVLGWQLAKLVAALRKCPKEVIILLKKRPRHSTPFGGTPNRRPMGSRHGQSVATLPKQKSRWSREGEKAVRPTLQEYVTASVPTGDIYITKESPEDNNDDNDTDNDVFRSGSESPQFSLPVIVDGKQRRATVSGGSPTFERPSNVVDDLATLPMRPKSQAINLAEKDAAIAALLAADNSLQRRAEGAGDEAVGKAEEPEDDSTNDDTENGSLLEVETPTPSDDKMDIMMSLAAAPAKKDEDEKKAETETQLKEERASSIQEFTVTKPTPVMRDMSPVSKKHWSKHQKDLKPDDDDVFVKPTKHVGFSDDVEEKQDEKQESYTHIVVGNVVQKIALDSSGHMAKTSPPVKMRTKTPSNRKKIDRRVSCKDLGTGDCEGWLYKRRQKDRKLSRQWAKRWCVLKTFNLFYFKFKEDEKAEGVIHLPAFQVSPAPNLKTKKFAFKIHNAGTSFYFASERQDDMLKWMNKLGLAAINYSPKKAVKRTESPTPPSTLENADDYSESDSGSDTSVSTSSLQPSPVAKRRPQEDSKDGAPGSTDELRDMLEMIQHENLTIDGKSKTDQRKSQCTPSLNLIGQADAKEIERLKQLQSMQRTLKAKEEELKDIEKLMTQPLTSGELTEFLDKHKDASSGQTK